MGQPSPDRRVHLSASPIDTQKFAESFAVECLQADDPQTPLVIGLIGELGSGKTTFTQGFARGLGIENDISSPTFILERRYSIKGNVRFKRFVHIDAYRIENEKESFHTGFHETFEDKEAIILIEWANNIKTLLPQSALLIAFEYGSKESERKIILN